MILAVLVLIVILIIFLKQKKETFNSLPSCRAIPLLFTQTGTQLINTYDRNSAGARTFTFRINYPKPFNEAPTLMVSMERQFMTDNIDRYHVANYSIWWENNSPSGFDLKFYITDVDRQLQSIVRWTAIGDLPKNLTKF